MVEIAVITGLSGAGRSAAAAVLEDLGFYVVDNLPTSLLPTIVDLASQPGRDRTPGARVRAPARRAACRTSPASAPTATASRSCTSTRPPPVLVQRYDATRRKHPLSDDAGGLLEAIELERTMLNPLKEHADLVIDSSELNVHQLKERLVSVFEQQGSTQLQIAVESFGYKNGLPLDADIVMDVRFLPNPHWDEALRPLTGHDPKVRDYVLERAVTSTFLDRFERMLLDSLPALPGGGAQLPDDRDRLHRRPPSLGRDRRGDRPAVRGPRHRRPHDAPRRRNRCLTAARCVG